MQYANHATTPDTSDSPDAMPAEIDPAIMHIYYSLNKQYRLDPNDKNLVKIVSSYVLTSNFTDIYYNKFDWVRQPYALNV